MHAEGLTRHAYLQYRTPAESIKLVGQQTTENFEFGYFTVELCKTGS